jgi:hypothetical protein
VTLLIGMSYRFLGNSGPVLRITQSGGEHLIALSEAEVATLVEASAGMARLLAQLFEGLRWPAAVPLIDPGP